MSINIKNREAEELLAEIRAVTGKEASQAILDLLRAEAARLRRLGERRRRIKTLSWRYSTRLPARPAASDEIIGYDGCGLPA